MEPPLDNSPGISMKTRTRIALNGRFSGTARPTGTQTAAFGLFDQVIRRNQEFDFIVFADRRFSGVAEWAGIPGTQLIDVAFQDWSRGRAQAWEQLAFPWLCRKWRCTLAHHPINTSPMLHGPARKIVTLHDLNFLRHPEWYTFKFRTIYSLCALPGLRNADRVVAISKYVQEHARQYLHVSDERLRMIYNGSKSLALPDDNTTAAGPYLLCVGSIPPHKNLARLIEAYQLVRTDYPDLELKVVGRPVAQSGRDDKLSQLLSAPGVRVLGYLSEADLARAYAGTRVFCYPSLEEGFGLPILEAMSADAPVVTSNVSCLPEIAGDAAVLVDPHRVESIAEGIREVLQWSPEEKARRVAAGRRRAAQFSWSAAADAYLALYREVVG